MNSAHPLLVLSAASVTRAQHDFRQAIDSLGGAWLTRESTVTDVERQVREHAPGAYVLFLGSADNPLPETVDLIGTLCDAHPLADVIYADKRVAVRSRGGSTEHLHFPDWSPHRMAYEQFVGDTFLVRVATLLSIAATLDPESSWDNQAFLFSCARRDVHVVHADEVWLSHDIHADKRSEQSDPAFRLTSVDGNAPVLQSANASLSSSRCSLITLTAGAPRDDAGTTPVFYEHLEVIRDSHASVAEHIVVIGDECDPRLRTSLLADPLLRVVDDSEPFNFARRSNRGSRAATGEILVFVNDDFIPLRTDWLEELTAPFADERVAITGATMLFANDTIQHLGVGVSDGSDRHFYRDFELTDPRVASLISMNREVDAVTGACLAVRADVFDEVGGLFDGFPLNYNDIDLCLKVRLRGRSVIHVGAPLGHHFESVTREAVLLPEEVSLFFARWPRRPLQSRFPFERFG